MLERLIYGSVLMIIGVAFLFGSNAGFTAGFLIVLLAVVGLFIAFPVVGLILFVILIIAMMIVATSRNHESSGEDASQKAREMGGCLVAALGILLMLPGGFAIFVALVFNDNVLLGSMAWVASILTGYGIMRYGCGA